MLRGDPLADVLVAIVHGERGGGLAVSRTLRGMAPGTQAGVHPVKEETCFAART